MAAVHVQHEWVVLRQALPLKLTLQDFNDQMDRGAELKPQVRKIRDRLQELQRNRG